MSDQERWDALMLQKTAAEVTLSDANEVANTVIDALKEGVDISVAARIIEDYWGAGTRGDKLRVQLSASFPQQNGQIILGAPLTQGDIDRLNGQLGGVRKYFEDMHSFVFDLVKRIMHQIKACDVNDQSAVEAYNEFRHNVILYLDYSNDWYWEARKVLENDECQNWGNLKIVTTRAQNGDYLFIDDFEETLQKTHAEYLEHTFNQKESEYWSLYDLRWKGERVVPRVKLPYLFAQYLLGVIEPLERS